MQVNVLVERALDKGALLCYSALVLTWSMRSSACSRASRGDGCSAVLHVELPIRPAPGRRRQAGKGRGGAATADEGDRRARQAARSPHVAKRGGAEDETVHEAWPASQGHEGNAQAVREPRRCRS